MAARGHVVFLNDGSSYPFDGETSEQDAEKFAREHSGEDPKISPLGGAEAYKGFSIITVPDPPEGVQIC